MSTSDKLSVYGKFQRILSLGAFWLLSLGAANAPALGAQQVLEACALPELARPARCGAVQVPENWAAPAGRTLSIGIAVVTAAKWRARPDPIVVLLGGPGEDAISAASIFTEQLAPLLEERDLLLIDQRGTGRSNALRCRLYSHDRAEENLQDFLPPAAVADCARELSRTNDLTRYSYADFARDLEHVRRVLGYERYNLSAGSYGTRAAQVFMRMYPHSVRTAFLGSVVPIDVPAPLTFARTTDDVLERTLQACEAESACSRAFPNLRAELEAIVQRLRSGDVRVAVPGREGLARLDRGRVLEWFRSLLYRPSSASELPWIIHRANEGDWSPIVDGILTGARTREEGISFGLFFSISCNEDVPFMSEEAVAKATQGTLLGDYRPRQQIAACKGWPSAALPEGYREPVHSSVPTMFVSGDTDAGSPLWFTRHVAENFPNRIEIVLVGRGHTEWSSCVGDRYERLVTTGTVSGVESTECPPTPRPAFRIQ